LLLLPITRGSHPLTVWKLNDFVPVIVLPVVDEDSIESNNEPRRRGWWWQVRRRNRPADAPDRDHGGVREQQQQQQPAVHHPMLLAEVVRFGEDETASSPYLLHLIRQGLPCSAVLTGPHTVGCNRIVQYCRENRWHYQCPRTRRMPLHEAALRCSCIHVIRALTNGGDWQMSTMIVDNLGNSPLHLLFAGISMHNMDASDIEEIVDLLLQPFPSITASIVNHVGDIALHCACAAPECMVPAVAVERLLEARPNSALHLNFKGQTPLHVHCQRRNASTAVAQQLIAQQQPLRCSIDSEGHSQLHYTAIMCNTDLIRLLVAEDPLSAYDRTTHDDRTALHLLCMQHPSSEYLPAVQALLAAAPDMATRPDERTLFTPLHLLLSGLRSSRNIALPIVQAIVREAPDCLKCADHNHCLPLHHACQVGADPTVVSCLLKAYPEAATAVTRKHDTALSLACTANVSAETVRMLLDVNCTATDLSNDYGFLPLHSVCRAYRPLLPIVQALVEANPASVRRLTHAGESAVHFACGAGKAVLELLTTTATALVNAEDDENSNKLMTSKVGNTPCELSTRKILPATN
jgi:ankyrin repeat protein